MTNFLWARTLLTAYRYVPKVIKEIDNVIAEHALSSSGFNGSGFGKFSTLTQIGKIEKLMSLKERALFIKTYVDEIISKLSLVKQKLLSEIFFENKRITNVVKCGQFSPRTYYRRILESLHDFEENMNKSDYKEMDFKRDFKDNWIAKIQETLLNKNTENKIENTSKKAVVYKKTA